nr:prostaglandin E2 receptor EP2 subtype isoform X3 [Leptinotarsa decemlineata]
MEVSWYYAILTTIAFLVGLAGNIAALWILFRTAKRRNKKHLFMLRCLASNDLTAQVGMLLLITLKRVHVLPEYLACAGFVFVRAFGLGSGCVAFVMALERWLALTRPFLYHQLVTYRILKRFLCCLWFSALFLTYLPFFGFGLYYNSENGQCLRYRNAVEIKDKIYAYFFFTFGSILCLCIALCNTSVICELSKIRSQQRVLVRRISRSILSNRVGCARYQTPEEVAFAKLMAFVCIIFLACWVPQLMTIPIAQFVPPSDIIRKFTAVADALLTVYLALDPFVYVLQNYMEGRFKLNCCVNRQSTSSLSSPSGVYSALPVVPHRQADFVC